MAKDIDTYIKGEWWGIVGTSERKNGPPCAQHPLQNIIRHKYHVINMSIALIPIGMYVGGEVD